MQEQRSTKDIAILIVGFFSSLKILLASFGIKLPDLDTDNMINLIVTGAILYAVWKNTYVSKKALKQKEALKEKHLL